MIRRLRETTLLALLLLIHLHVSVLPAAGRDEEPEKPETRAERVAGRWRISLQGLPDDHDPILASLAVEGDLLIGTLTVGRKTVSIHSGRIVGDQFRFTFRHVSGLVYKMKGAPGPRGLEGTWEGGRESGRWTARPLGI